MKKDKIKEEDLIYMDEIEIYKLVLEGRLYRFPNGFWDNHSDAAKNLTKFLIEDILKLDDIGITKMSHPTFKNNKLGGMVNIVYGGSVYRTIDDAYPGRFKPWEMKTTPMGTWNKETAIEATKWMIEEKLKWSDEDIKNNLNIHIFKKCGLLGMIGLIYNNSTYDAINDVYPNRFKPWEMAMSPHNLWNEKTGKQATKWMIEEKLKWNDEDIKNNLNIKVFDDYGLKGMLTVLYNDSAFNALDDLYPNKFKPWELKKSSIKKWDEKNIIEATKWLLEEKLKWNDEKILRNLSSKVFTEYGLSAMFWNMKNNLYETLNLAYPGRFPKITFMNRKYLNRNE